MSRAPCGQLGVPTGFVGRGADDGQPARTVPLLEAFEIRCFRAAGRAPRTPEIQQRYLASESRKSHRSARSIVQIEVRCGIRPCWTNRFDVGKLWWFGVVGGVDGPPS